MREIDTIIIHCSDSDRKSHDDISVIRKWHKEKGWSDVGYHKFIKTTGEIQDGRPEYEIGAHTQGHNKSSIGICLHGKGEPTQEQKDALETLLIDLCSRYELEKTDIYPHRYFNKDKTCPGWDLESWLDSRKWH